MEVDEGETREGKGQNRPQTIILYRISMAFGFSGLCVIKIILRVFSNIIINVGGLSR